MKRIDLFRSRELGKSWGGSMGEAGRPRHVGGVRLGEAGERRARGQPRQMVLGAEGIDVERGGGSGEEDTPHREQIGQNL